MRASTEPSHVDVDRIIQRAGQLGEGSSEVGTIMCATKLAEKLLGEEQRDELTFRQAQKRKPVSLFCVEKAVLLRVEFDRSVKPIAHKVDVALDRCGLTSSRSPRIREFGHDPSRRASSMAATRARTGRAARCMAKAPPFRARENGVADVATAFWRAREPSYSGPWDKDGTRVREKDFF